MMLDKPEVTEPEETAADLRNKLIKRLAVAGVLVAVLLGVLAFFDYLSTPPEESDAPEFTQPVPVAPKKTLSQPVTPASDLPESPTPVPVVAEPPPPPPQPVAQPVLPSATAPETKPEAAAPRQDTRQPGPVPAVAKSVGPTSTPVPAPVEPRVLRPVPESTAAPTVIIAPGSVVVPAAKPAAHVLEARPAPVVAPSGASRLFSGFLLQAGVFTSQQRAEELHAKLTLSGVPSTLETRVQVGPFTTRQEAEAAQAKLKELGVETVLVPPRSAKH